MPIQLSGNHKVIIIIALILSILIIPTYHLIVKADDISDLQSQIDQKNAQIAQIGQTISGLKSQLNGYTSQANSLSSNYYLIQNNINSTETQITQETQLVNQLSTLVTQRKEQLNDLINQKNAREKELYISMQINPLQFIFSSNDFSSIINGYVLTEGQIDQNSKDIVSINQQIDQINQNISQLDQDQTNLNQEVLSLNQEKASVANSLNAVKGNINNTNGSISANNASINNLSSQIASLNQQIQQIAALAAAKANASNASNSQSQAYTGTNGYVFISKGWGTYVGMSQWGAYGMANQGSSATAIISHYYTGATVITNPGLDNLTVSVAGHGTMSMGHYLAGIAEVPSTWPRAAADAQIIASRSYAYYAYVHNGSSYAFPTNTSFQVYGGGTAMQQEVSDTTDQIAEYNGSVIDALFYSSSGGYTLTPSCVWGGSQGYSHCSSASDSSYPYLSSVADPADDSANGASAFDWHAFYQNPNRSPNQVANIVNAALLLCVNVSNCNLYNNNEGNGFGNTVTQDDKLHFNEDPISGQNYINNFPDVESSLSAHGQAPIGSLSYIVVTYTGSGQLATKVTAYSPNYPQGVSIDGGVFFTAYNMSSPGSDELYGIRYYIN